MSELQAQNSEASQDLSFYLGIFKNRWWIILLTGLLCGSLMYLLSVSQTPVYESQIRLIKDVNVAVADSTRGGVANGISSALDPALTGEEIIKSRAVIQKALESQPLFSGEDPRAFQYSITAVTDKINPILTVVYRDSSPERVQIFLNALGKAYIQNDLESRRAAARQAIEYLEATLPQARKSLQVAQQKYQDFLTRNGEIAPSQLQGSLSTNTLQIDRDLQAQDLALKGLLGTRQRIYQRMGGVSEDQALASSALSQDPYYQKLLSTLQEKYRQLAQYQISYKESYPPLQGVRKEIATIEALIAKQTAMLLSDSLFRRAKPPQGTSDAKPLVDSTVLGAESGETVAEGSVESPQLTLANPIRDTLTTQLVQVQTQIASTEASIRALQQAKGSVRGRLDGLTAKVVEQTNLTNQVENSLRSLNDLVQKVDNFRLAAVQQVTPWSVLEPSELPGYPIAPKPTNSGLFGLAGGLVLGFLLAYYLELTNNRLRRKEDFARILGIPFLGYVPYSPSVRGFFALDGADPSSDEQAPRPNFFRTLVQNVQRWRRRGRSQRQSAYGRYRGAYENSRFKESFRQIATRLLFSKPEEELRTILITSCIPSEGKSTCSLYIANALVELGKRVLLIDCDLRRPSLHALLGIPNREGLSVVLTSSSVLPIQVVQRDIGRLDFGIITSGPVVPNPAALLSSQRFASLMTVLKEDYDIILIDTPPSMAFADSQIIAAHTDAILFVCSRGVLKPQYLADAKNGFTPNDKKLVGFVINSTTEDALDEPYYKQNYYDYYTYRAGRETESRGSVPEQN
ncbi:GumC family protein [Anthocerotibacter panamensis]|uniref:GumC family protein n=1 Tax=Anthocerotibacter panamensis TaxID=2857077 RepID=UPI001C407F00|nr:polysaccharide biosynthesis tyrosine autokinase [Anthocerotibacter panamensis]